MSAEEHRVTPGDWDSWISRPDGRQLIVAGPGTGKTEFLVRRVAHLVENGIANRDQVAVFSFSRKAAADLRRRISEKLGTPGTPIESSTFHSLALRILEAGTGRRPIPLTSPEQVGVVGSLLKSENPESWPVAYRGLLESPGFAGEIADFLMRCSERLLSPADLAERARLRSDWKGIPEFFARYRSHLEEIERIDYGTLLVKAVEFLGTDRGREIAGRYTHVLVDEYQDTSPAQAAIAELLAGEDGNLTVAGDPYQSVYSFRGAELRNISRFQEEHPDCVRIVLEESFRVPADILESALRVVSSGDLPGAAGAVTAADHVGRVDAFIFDQETGEAEWIAQEIEHAIRVEGITPSRVAILVRSKREMLNELSRALDRRGLPHDPPRRRVVDHPAVQLIHDLVTVAISGGDTSNISPGEAADTDRAMRRILLGPLFSTSLGKERELVRRRRATGKSWVTVLSEALATDIVSLLADAGWATEAPASDGFWRLWTGLASFRELVDAEDKAPWRLALASFSQALGRQAERDAAVSLQDYFALTDEDDFEATPLISPASTGGRIALTTLHQAKGLEYDLVFIANAVEGVFPDLRRSRRMLRPELLSPDRTTDSGALHTFQLQEEMRLAYTAMTRARRRVVWTATDAGVDQGEHRPSRFLVAASSAGTLDRLGPPGDIDREPVTASEFETRLRRDLLDPVSPTVSRLAAASVLSSAPGQMWDPSRFAGVAAPGPDRPVLPAVIRLSPSQADSYASCPRKYVLERRMRLGADSSPYAAFGSLVHSVLEIAERRVLGTDARHAPLPLAMEVLDQVWVAADFGTPALTEAWRLHAIEGVTKLYENWPGTGTPVALETRVESDIEGVAWVGLIDRLERVDDGLKVIDYKSGKTQPGKDAVARSIQLAFYAHAVESAGVDKVVGAEMWFPRASTIKVGIRMFDLSLLEEVTEAMSQITRSIVAEDWQPRVHEGCGRCEFINSCPAWPEGRGAYLP